MRIFASIVRFIAAFLPKKAEAVKRQKRAASPALDPVLLARRKLEAKRAEREGDWGETQFFKPD